MSVPSPRPTLLPGVRVLWRDAGTAQVGADPSTGMVVSGLPAGSADFLGVLDGRRTEAEALTAATELGLAAEDAADLLAALRACGAVADGDPAADLGTRLPGAVRQRLVPELGGVGRRCRAPSTGVGGVSAGAAPGTSPDPLTHATSDPTEGGPPWPAARTPGAGVRAGGAAPARAIDAAAGAVVAARSRARVVVRGGGRICVPLAALLAAAGVGHVHVDVDGTVEPAEVAVGGHRADDVRRPRATAAAEAVRAVAPEVDTRPPRGGVTPHFVVLARAESPPVLAALTPETRRVPHLALAVRGGLAVVGPLVVPGRTACLHCLYLHRCDRDPHWPVLAAQFGTGPEEGHCSAAIAAVAAGVAALQVLGQLDGGEPEALSATLELGSPGRLVRRRTWRPHPRCGCLRTVLADVG
jgi:hypothetical protein